MSRPLRSLTLVQRLSTPLRSSHTTLRCGGLGASYATQAHEQARLHLHHPPAKKPSVFGQPTSISHPHLGEQQPLRFATCRRWRRCVIHVPRRMSFADGSTHVRVCVYTRAQSSRTRSRPEFQLRNMNAGASNWSTASRTGAWSCAWRATSST